MARGIAPRPPSDEPNSQARGTRACSRIAATAHYASVPRAQLRAGETVFVSGAAESVGMAAVGVARNLGATVIAGTNSPDKGDVARRQGATHAIGYSCEPVRDRLLELTRGRGVCGCVACAGLGRSHSADRIHER